MEERKVVTANEIKELVTILNNSSRKYYNGEEPDLSDLEYDSMLTLLENAERETGVQFENSPTKKVGFSVLDSIPKKKLPRQMLSLNKVKNDKKGIYYWSKERALLASLKLDGLSCMLEYKNGILIGGYTRGNGTIGSDVTDIIKTLPSVPHRIRDERDLLVVGEIIIRENIFNKINKKREEKGQKTFSTSRNLASGTLMSLDTKVGRERGLEFVAFGRYIDDLSENQYDSLQELKRDFVVVPHILLTSNLEEITGAIEILRYEASANNYPIDGIVFTFNNGEIRRRCKPTEKFPTHSMAYKFEDEHETSVLREIEWSMSRSGVLTPVAIFDKVELDGTEVTRASVHNVSMLKALELGIGDTIKVVKANQIIPQIIENITKSNSLKIPTSCPYCRGELTTEGDKSLELVCKNENCQEQQLLRINHFLSKDALNAKGISEKILKKLMNLGEVKNLYDVLDLPKRREKLIKKNLPSLGRKTINNICDAIEKSCSTTLDRFLIGLGIDGVGKKVAKDIANKYPTIDDVMHTLSISGLKTIEGIDTTAETIYWGITDSRDKIERLISWIRFEDVSHETTVTNGNLFEGKVFVFTGKTKEFKNRKEVENFIVSNGGKMSGSVSSKTSFLICNAVETSSKYKKAQELGIEIITENQLKNMLGEE